MTTENATGVLEARQKTLVVQVRYLAVRKPFVDEKADPDATLAIFKPEVLNFFGLKEGSVDGGTKTYHFAIDGNALTDLSVTLGSVAHGKHGLKLDLIEVFEQG